MFRIQPSEKCFHYYTELYNNTEDNDFLPILNWCTRYFTGKYTKIELQIVCSPEGLLCISIRIESPYEITQYKIQLIPIHII